MLLLLISFKESPKHLVRASHAPAMLFVQTLQRVGACIHLSTRRMQITAEIKRPPMHNKTHTIEHISKLLKHKKEHQTNSATMQHEYWMRCDVMCSALP